MFPIGDDDSDLKTFPYVNYFLIAANIIVYVIFQQLGTNDAFTYAYSTVPREIVTGVDLQGVQDILDATGRVIGRVRLEQSPQPLFLTVISSTFMHGSLMHIFGNMLYLWIFGDNLENRLGHLRYLAFYMVCGTLAAIAQIATDSSSIIPMLGASGAISGVLGGYLLMFPRRRVTVLLFVFVTHVPAAIALGAWIIFQIIESLYKNPAAGGVAYMAHVGGFIGGFVLVKVFALGTTSR